jgi:hypothetical protein
MALVGKFFISNLLLNKILIFYSCSITQCFSENVKNFISLLLFRFYFVCLFIYLIIFCYCAAYLLRSIDIPTLPSEQRKQIAS